MKKILVTILGINLLIFGGALSADASLTKIGTVDLTYPNPHYNGSGECDYWLYPTGTFDLILDDNNNGKALVWLDYTNFKPGIGDNDEPLYLGGTWLEQIEWADSLNDENAVIIDPDSNIAEIIWDEFDPEWRLPITPVPLGIEIFQKKASEMGHLFFVEGINYPSTGLKFNNLC